jgi:calcineurin-like phosphoesterase family protein
MCHQAGAAVSGATWFVADLHLMHEKVAELRGFRSCGWHDDHLMKQWRKQVRDGDLVYVLGDLSGGGRRAERLALEMLHMLPGRKRLIAGNHDSVASIHRKLSPHVEVFREVFERIGDFGRTRIDGVDVLLSHYPYEADHYTEPREMQYRLRDLGAPLIHGHTHSSERFNGREACVSWEAWGRLVSTGDLTPWLNQMKERQ